MVTLAPSEPPPPTTVRYEGGMAQATQVMLLVDAPRSEHDAVSELVGCPPSPLAPVTGEGSLHRLHPPAGQWHLEAPGGMPLEEQLRYLLENTSDDPRTWSKVGARWKAELRCCVFMQSLVESFHLPPELLAQVCLRRWRFHAVLFSATDPEVLSLVMRK